MNSPLKLNMDDILKLAPLEERIYRHRCVERWSIVVPWIGFSFNVLAKLVEPHAKRPSSSPSQPTTIARKCPWPDHAGIDFPYVEGLRLDEAMHPLALLCVGHVRRNAAAQDGAPVRMVVPWKYGFKSIKSIVKIRFVKAAAHHLEHFYAPASTASIPT